MKKSLLALAVLTAAGAASAQSSVTVYGRIDVGGVLDSGSTSGKRVQINSGVAGGSRLGFRGVEDLGGGLKAGFVAETGFCSDTNASAPNFCTGGNNFMGRQAHVDLVGNFGALTAGRQYTPMWSQFLAVDPFGTGTAGQITNLFDASNGKANPRVNNSAIYTTPTVEGFTASALVGFGETTGNWRASRSTGFLAKYVSGPVYVGLGYEGRENTAGTGSSGTGGYRDINLAGTYDLGAVKLAAMYQTTKAPGTLWVNARDLMIGATIPVGNGAIQTSFVKNDDRTSSNKDANQVALGYNYNLSKRTQIYTAFSRIVNKNGATFTVGNATDTGTGNKAFNLGVGHNF